MSLQPTRVIVVLARLVDDFEVVPGAYATDLGQLVKTRQIKIPRACMWKASSLPKDVEKAREFAAKEGYTVFVYPKGTRDVLARAKREISEGTPCAT